MANLSYHLLVRYDELSIYFINVKVNPICYPYFWEVPVREGTCPGPLALWGWVACSFTRRLYLPSISNRSPFAVRWTVGERPTIGSRWVPSRNLHHSRQALWPLCYSPIRSRTLMITIFVNIDRLSCWKYEIFVLYQTFKIYATCFAVMLE